MFHFGKEKIILQVLESDLHSNPGFAKYYIYYLGQVSSTNPDHRVNGHNSYIVGLFWNEILSCMQDVSFT